MNVDQLPVVSHASLGGFDIVNGDFNKADMLYMYTLLKERNRLVANYVPSKVNRLSQLIESRAHIHMLRRVPTPVSFEYADVAQSLCSYQISVLIIIFREGNRNAGINY